VLHRDAALDGQRLWFDAVGIAAKGPAAGLTLAILGGLVQYAAMDCPQEDMTQTAGDIVVPAAASGMTLWAIAAGAAPFAPEVVLPAAIGIAVWESGLKRLF